MLWWYSVNTQYFVLYKSSFTSQFVEGKLRNLQKLLRYLSGAVNWTFKYSTCDCGGWSVPLVFPGCGCLLVFLLLFLCYSQMIYDLKCNDQLHRFHLYVISENSWCHAIFVTIFQQNIHLHEYIKIFSMVYRGVVNFWDVWPKWCIIFKHIFLYLIILFCSSS